MSSRRAPNEAPADAFASATGRTRLPEDEADEEIPLPPLDDGAADEEIEPTEMEDLLTPLDDPSADPFDDSAASDLDTGLDVGVDDGASGEDEPAEDGVDVGALDEDVRIKDTEGNGALDDRHEGFTEDDSTNFEADQDLRGDDDGGAEGTGDHGEDDVSEADLPQFDADEEGDFEGEDMASEMAIEPDSSLPPWDALRWTALPSMAVPLCSLAIAAGRVVAGGEVVLLVDEGADVATRTGFEGGASSVAVTEEAIVVAGPRGRLWISSDGGASASAITGWRGSRSAALLAATPGRIWVLSDDELWSMSPAAGRATEARSGGVACIATCGATLIALTHTPAGAAPVAAIERLRSDDEGWQTTKIEGEAAAVARSEEVEIAAAAGGRLFAVASREALCVSRDGGLSFRSFALPGTVALAFAGDDVTAPLLALLAHPTEDAASVVLVPPEGEPTRIAEIGGVGGDGGSSEEEDAAFGKAAMRWDAAREIAWVACRVGLFALTPARKH